MPCDVYLDEPWLSIRWNERHQCIHAEWFGAIDTVEFRSGTVKILAAVRDRHTTALVSDNRRLEVIANQDQLWINERWAPMAAASGLKRIGVVLASQGLGRTGSEGIISRFEGKAFETRTFDTVDEALSWVGTDSP